MLSLTLTLYSHGVFTDISTLHPAVPHGAFTEQQMFGDVDSRIAGGIVGMILLMFLSALLFLLLRTVKSRRIQRDPEGHAAIALEKHPTVVNTQLKLMMSET